MGKTNIFNYNQISYFVSTISLVITCLLLSVRVDAQSEDCLIGIVPADEFYEYSYIQNSNQESNSNGINFTTYIAVNLPLCGTECLQIDVPIPNNPIIGLENTYDYSEIGFSSHLFNVFTACFIFSVTRTF